MHRIVLALVTLVSFATAPAAAIYQIAGPTSVYAGLKNQTFTCVQGKNKLPVCWKVINATFDPTALTLGPSGTPYSANQLSPELHINPAPSQIATTAIVEALSKDRKKTYATKTVYLLPQLNAHVNPVTISKYGKDLSVPIIIPRYSSTSLTARVKGAGVALLDWKLTEPSGGQVAMKSSSAPTTAVPTGQPLSTSSTDSVLFTPVTQGNFLLTVSVDGQSQIFTTLCIKVIAPTKISISPDSTLSLELGKSQKFFAKAVDASGQEAADAVVWAQPDANSLSHASFRDNGDSSITITGSNIGPFLADVAVATDPAPAQSPTASKDTIAAQVGKGPSAQVNLLVGDLPSSVTQLNSYVTAVSPGGFADLTAALAPIKNQTQSETGAVAVESLLASAAKAQTSLEALATAQKWLQVVASFYTKYIALHPDPKDPLRVTADSQYSTAVSAYQAALSQIQPLAAAIVSARGVVSDFVTKLDAPVSVIGKIPYTPVANSNLLPALPTQIQELSDIVGIFGTNLPALALAHEHAPTLKTALALFAKMPTDAANFATDPNKLPSPGATATLPSPSWAAITTSLTAVANDLALAETGVSTTTIPAPANTGLYNKITYLLKASEAFSNASNGELVAFEKKLEATDELETLTAGVSVVQTINNTRSQALSTLLTNWAVYSAVITPADAQAVPPSTTANFSLALSESNTLISLYAGYATTLAYLPVLVNVSAESDAKTVPLFYYRDVHRLMAVLCPSVTTTSFGPTTDLTTFKQQLAGQSFSLDDARAGVAESQSQYLAATSGAVNAQGQVTQYTAQLAAKNAQLEREKLAETQLSGQVNIDTTRVQQDQTALSSAQTALSSNTSPAQAATLQGAVQAATIKLNTDQIQLTKAQNALSLEQQREANLNSDVTALTAKQAAAQSALAQAQSAQTAAQTAMDTFISAESAARNQSAQVGIAEQSAFISNRANQPVLISAGNPTATDPAARVSITGFPDQARLFVRGSKLDVALVENLIAEYDRPAPQAKLTLWQLQMDVLEQPGDVNKADLKLQKIRADISRIRSISESVGSIFRESLFTEVRTAEGQSLLSQQTGTGGNAQEDDRIKRFSFFNDRILKGLGYVGHLEANSNPYRTAFALRNIPDPSAGSTIAETLLILAMGSSSHVDATIKRFGEKIEPVLANWESTEAFKSIARAGISAEEDGLDPDQKGLIPNLRIDETWKTHHARFLRVFSRTLRALWSDGLVTPESESRTIETLNPFQSELLAALQRNVLINSVDEMHKKQMRLDEITVKNDALVKQGRKDFELLAEMRRLQDELAVRYQFIINTFNLDSDLSQSNRPLPKNYKGIPAQAPSMKALEAIFGSVIEYKKFVLQFPLTLVNARVAALDDRLKKIIEAVEDDVDQEFIEPGIYQVRQDLQKAALNVGILQRTSMLSTDRVISRVDAGASAQLAAGGQTNFLADAQDLAKLAVAAGSKSALGFLNSLNANVPEPPQEIYGVTTGGEFTITPYFDPSGQALRFSFDFLSATRVRDPNGTTSAQLPRIENHTVDLEAQLSTFELREFSSYETNSQLGSPIHRWGGIPLLNETPIIKEIPLIGYFVRKGGHAAVAQEDIILGQATIYPTILDIVNLLTPVSSKAPIGGG